MNTPQHFILAVLSSLLEKVSSLAQVLPHNEQKRHSQLNLLTYLLYH